MRKISAVLVILAMMAVCAPQARAQMNVVGGRCPEVTPNCPFCPPKTGQETCYNYTNASVTCNATWAQDAWYADPAGSYDYGCTRGAGSWANWNADGGRFTANGDGTITDSATDLMWVANPTAASRGGTYSWYDAINASENLTYATYDDWRLPNVKELLSIMDYGAAFPSIDTNFFTSQSNNYWASTTYAATTAQGWYLSFSSGIIGRIAKSNTYYIRPVRNAE